MVGLLCRDCPHWYGSEDDGYGPCTIKSQRGARRPLTYGGHACDEGYDLVAGAVLFVGRPGAPAGSAPKKARPPPPTAKRKGAAPKPRAKRMR